MESIARRENIAHINNHFSVKVILLDEKSTPLPHWHEHIELLYFLEGSAKVICNDTAYLVKAGDFIVVNASQIHTINASAAMKFCCIILYPSFFADIYYDHHTLLQNYISDDKTIGEWVSHIIKEHYANTAGSDMVIKSYAYGIMAYLMRHYTSHIITDREFVANCSKSEKINALIFYISNHYHEKISSEDMASICYMNKSHFCRFFKKCFDKSPIDFLNDYRIEKACQLLTNTDNSITDIALCVGFQDINYFSRIFKAHKNRTPSEYRKSHLEKK